jgi:ATP-binding cassette subfamily B protein
MFLDFAGHTMSVAKPLMDYVRSLKPKKSLAESVSIFKRLLKYHKKYYLFISAIVIFCAVRAYLSVLEPLYTYLIVQNVVEKGITSLLPNYLLIILSSGIGAAVISFIISLVNGAMSQYIVRDIRSDYYTSLRGKSYSFYDSVAVGDLTSRATLDLQVVDAFVRTWLGTVLNAVFTAIAILLVILPVSTIMTLISMATMPLIFYFDTRLFLDTQPLFRNMQLILGRLGSYIQQNIIGMKTVRIFRREKDMVEGFKQGEEVFVQTAIKAGKIQSKLMPLSPTILTLGIAAVYVYAGYSIAVLGSALTVADVVLFATSMLRLTFPLRDLSTSIGNWINASAGLERVFETMGTQRTVQDFPDAEDITIKHGKVEFKNVTFGYVQDKPVLKNVSFTVNPGEKIAVLGATGSGKSSLIYLIPRFYDITSGSITIDGTDIRKFKLSSLRPQVGVILQDVFLFSGTVRDNIAFGKPDASMEEIVKVAKMARIHDFIQSLPDGYNSFVGERGVTLSGGQRQRITIARALLINPKILIMDDSLSFVDAKTEQEIQAAVDEAMEGRTTFIIAQRLSTIRHADKILVFDNGKIAEFGTHKELMAREGIYRKIYETQFIEKSSIITEVDD